MAEKKTEIPAIICAGRDGQAVIYGYVDALPDADQPTRIRRARMVLEWSRECGGLLGLATRGPQPGTRITCAVSETTNTARQALTVTPEAARALDEWPDA